MAQEDSRGLGKIIGFIRAINILFLVMNIYYFCYPFFHAADRTNGMVDRILLNFQHDTGLFTSSPVTKCSNLMFLFFSSMGAKGRRAPEMAWRYTSCYLAAGLFLHWESELFLTAGWSVPLITLAYVSALTAKYICLLTVGMWIGRLLRGHLMDDVFNEENEPLMQETRLITNEYSVSLPTWFYYKKKWYDGWINVILPQRGCIVVGSPGSGKSYCVINQFIKQQIGEDYVLYCYDFEFPDLSLIVYNHLFKNKDKYKANVQSYVINFDDSRHGHHCNPINPTFMSDVVNTYESAYVVILNLNRTWIQKQDNFFVESPIVLFAAIIRYLKIYENGKHCTFPHVIELLNKPYSDIFTILTSYRELENYLLPFMDAWKGRAMEQLQGQVVNAKIPLSRMISPSLYWVVSGNDFTLDINNPDESKVLCIGNNPDRQNICSAVLGLYNAHIVKMVSHKGKLKCFILVDEIPTTYLKGFDTLIAATCSNRVTVCLGAQDFSQLVRNYGEKEAHVIRSTVGNVFSGRVLGETAKNLSGRFGRVLQQRKFINMTREGTSTSISTQPDSLIPASKTSNLSQGTLVGSVCDNFQGKMEQRIFRCEIVVDSARMAAETKAYKPIPVITNFTGGDGKDHMRGKIGRNYYRIEEGVSGIIQKELRRVENNPNLKHLLETEDDG